MNISDRINGFSSDSGLSNVPIIFSAGTAYSGFSNVLKNLDISNFSLSSASMNYIMCWLATGQTGALVTGGVLTVGSVSGSTNVANISNVNGNQKIDSNSGGLNGAFCKTILTCTVGQDSGGFPCKGWTVVGNAGTA